MEQLNLNQLIADKCVLIRKLESLRENMRTLMEVIDNDELDKDWKTFSVSHIDKNNRLRSNYWSWKFQSQELERKIYNLTECIKVQRSLNLAQTKKLENAEIDAGLGVGNSKCDFEKAY